LVDFEQIYKLENTFMILFQQFTSSSDDSILFKKTITSNEWIKQKGKHQKFNFFY